jgi:hypothetical protein
MFSMASVIAGRHCFAAIAESARIALRRPWKNIVMALILTSLAAPSIVGANFLALVPYVSTFLSAFFLLLVFGSSALYLALAYASSEEYTAMPTLDSCGRPTYSSAKYRCSRYRGERAKKSDDSAN